MTKPTISVIVPVYNCERTVVAAVESIFATGYPELEVVIVNDGSRDASQQLIDGYCQQHPQRRIVRLQHPGGVNRGIVESRNLAIRHATGELVTLLDADDTYYPNRFDQSVEFLARHPEVDAAFESFEYVFDDGERSARLQGKSNANNAGGKHSLQPDAIMQLSGTALYQAFLAGKLPKSATSVTLRRSVFDTYGLFPPTRIVTDRVLWLKLFASGRILPCSTNVVTGYRIHDSSICAQHSGRGSSLAGPLWALCTTYRWLKSRASVPEVNKELTRQAIRGKFYQYCATILQRQYDPIAHLVGVPWLVARSAPSLVFETRWWKALVLLWARGLHLRR